MLFRIIFLFLLLVNFTSLSAQSKKQTQDAIFTVNKKPITREEFVYLYKKNHQNKSEDYTEEKIREYLNLFINFKLKVTEAQHRGIDTTQAFIKEFNSYRDELRKPYLPDSKLLDSLVKLTYGRMNEEINASHILINVKLDAAPEDTVAAYNKVLEIRNKAIHGENFETLAQSYSEDPSAKSNKGNLGYFTAMQMVFPFENAAYSTNKNDVSQPVRTKFGYHLIKVNDRKPARGEVEVSHIMIRTGENKDNDQAKNQIFDIYDQLQKEVAWEELCRQFSEDPSTKESGGRLRPFGVGVMGSVPEFEQVAFALQKPGEISDPFQTQFGWHIIRLENKIPVAPFDQVSTTLKNKVSRDERVQVSKQSVYSKIKAEYGYTENAEIKKKVLLLADSSLQKGVWKAPQYGNAEKEKLFTLDNKTFFVKGFLAYAQENQKPNNLAPANYLESLFNAYTESELLTALEQKIIDKSPEYKWLLREYYEGILLFDIMEKEVWNKASIDSVGQRNYFNDNKTKYLASERIKGGIYSSTTKEHLELLKEELSADDSVKATEIINQYKIKVDSGAFEKDDRIVLSKIPWQQGVHQAENNNSHYLIAVKDILPPGSKSFDEARPEVISDYQTYLETQWITQLKKKYPVKVNKKPLQAALDELKSIKTN
jgi:peptidyl-prolyl cis-trans isomerase SurA